MATTEGDKKLIETALARGSTVPQIAALLALPLTTVEEVVRSFSTVC